jgi:hypothetical protein
VTLDPGKIPLPPPLHPATEALLRYFESDHLPEHLAGVSRQFEALAWDLAGRNGSPQGPEVTAGLRKLLEAKDCFVRATLTQHEEAEVAHAYNER